MADLIEWDDFAENTAEYTGLDSGEILRETNVYIDLGMDSLGLFSLGMFLMKNYKIKLPLSSVAMIETLGDIFDLLNKYRSED